MVKIRIQPNCGNAPRKLFLKDVNVAFINGDIKFFMDNISDAISWEIVGQSFVTGKAIFLESVQEHKLWKAQELVIDTIITHGPDASVSGQITMADNSKIAFCDIYRFKSAGGTTINSIKTFFAEQLEVDV